jgi:hypothetical protein
MSEWQPIETAPKDGTDLLLAWNWRGRYVSIGKWARVNYLDWDTDRVVDSECWVQWESLNSIVDTCVLVGPNAPTHWMPLPEPPMVVSVPLEQIRGDKGVEST